MEIIQDLVEKELIKSALPKTAKHYIIYRQERAKLREKINKDLCNVLIPTSPSPFSGFVALFPREEIIFTDITIEQAIKFLVSDGVVNPM